MSDPSPQDILDDLYILIGSQQGEPTDEQLFID